MQSLLTTIPQKFKFLKDMDQSEWSISINNTIINTKSAKQLNKVLSALPIKPPPVVEIVKSAKVKCFYVLFNVNI